METSPVFIHSWGFDLPKKDWMTTSKRAIRKHMANVESNDDDLFHVFHHHRCKTVT